MCRHGSFTVIIVTPYRTFSLAAAFFLETLHSHLSGVENARLLVRDYSRSFTEVDISFIRDVLLIKPDVIGFSSFFWNLEQNLKLADLAKSLHPATFTVFGGPQVGNVAQAARLLEDHPSIDSALCGEADLRFPELVCRVLSGEAIRDLGGLALRNADNIYIENGPTIVRDLDKLPLVFHEAGEYVGKYLSTRGAIPFQTLRGCRNNCSYCLYPSGKLRLFPLDRLEKELAFLCRRNVRHVRVCDSHFAGSKARAMELFRIIKSLNSVTAFYIYPDPLHVDRDYVRAARDANCKVISQGVETMDPEVSEAVNRRFELNAYRKAAFALREGKNMPQVDMMFGLPKQTTQGFCRDLVRLRLDRIDNVLFSPLMVFPGTELASDTDGNELTIIETPQRYGFSSALGKDEYVSLLVMTESYRFLSLLHRTDRYIRSALKCDSHYTQCLDNWFNASLGQFRNDILELCEALSVKAGFIKANVMSLAEQVITLLVEAMGQKLQDLEFLAETVRMDILEVAMKRRKDELAQDIHPQPGRARGVLFADEIVQQHWVLDEDVWLESYAAPYSILSNGQDSIPGEKGNQAFCLYFCPTSAIFFMDIREFLFLERFKRPSYIFDGESPYSSAALNLARKWLRIGVLTNPEG